MICPDCKICGLPLPICSCTTPDAVYYQVETPRLDVTVKRQVSPQEGMSDYDKSKVFVEAFLFGRQGNYRPTLEQKGRDTFAHD